MNNTNFLKNLALWLILGLILILVFNVFNSSRKEVAKVIFSQFIGDVQAGRVIEVTMRGNSIRGKYKLDSDTGPSGAIENMVHGSDGPERAKIEIGILFGKDWAV